MSGQWACSTAELVVRGKLLVFYATVPRSDQVMLIIIYIIITLLLGTQQSVLDRDTPRLDSPKCMVLCLRSKAGYGRNE